MNKKGLTYIILMVMFLITPAFYAFSKLSTFFHSTNIIEIIIKLFNTALNLNNKTLMLPLVVMEIGILLTLIITMIFINKNFKNIPNNNTLKIVLNTIIICLIALPINFTINSIIKNGYLAFSLYCIIIYIIGIILFGKISINAQQITLSLLIILGISLASSLSSISISGMFTRFILLTPLLVSVYLNAQDVEAQNETVATKDYILFCLAIMIFVIYNVAI